MGDAEGYQGRGVLGCRDVGEVYAVYDLRRGLWGRMVGRVTGCSGGGRMIGGVKS